MYMLVRKGIIQLAPMCPEHGSKNAIMLIPDHKNAKRLAKHFSRQPGKNGVRPALIGSSPDESLESVLALNASSDNGVFVLVGWTERGSPMFQPYARGVR